MGVIALGAKMAKADGVVTWVEVDAFKQIFDIPDSQSRNVARVFDIAKKTTDGFQAYAKQLADVFHDELQILEDVLDGLFHIAKADDVVHEAELEYLHTVAAIFGFEDYEFERIAARHVTEKDSDPYLVLGVDRTMTDEEIRRVYRRLVVENHPDRHIAMGMPEEAVQIADEKLAAINDAWDRIAKERGL